VKLHIGCSPHTGKLKVSAAGLKHGACPIVSGDDRLALLGPNTEFEPGEPCAHSRMGGSGGRAQRLRSDPECDKITGEACRNSCPCLYP